MCRQNGEGEVGNAGNRGSLLTHLTGPNPIALEPSQVRDIMRAVWELNGTLLSLIYPSALGSVRSSCSCVKICRTAGN